MKTLRAWLRTRRRRQARVSVGGLVRACATLSIAASVMASQAVAYSNEPGLNGVASWLAQRKVEIRCLTQEESASDYVIGSIGAEAYVEGWRDPKGGWHPKSWAVFKYGHCETLLALMAGNASGYSLYDISFSALILTHEAGHLRGHRWSVDEAKTQCWALRHFRYVIERLGVSDRDVQRLMVAQALEIHWSLSSVYHTPNCKVPTP